MNKIFLTSYLDLYEKDELGNRTPINFGNKNNILDNLKKSINKYDKLLYVASTENNIENTDYYASLTFTSFDMTLPFKEYNILDIRTKNEAEKLINEADLIFLCGGHVPTQNEFFNNINLKELIKNTNAVIVGGSAGSMNCARTVYCPPELEGESLDINFKKELLGLDLTNINILPHFNEIKDTILDDKKFMDDIIIPDSYDRLIYAINDGSYILIENGKPFIYGEAYLIENGNITMINEDDNILEIKE